MEPIEKRERKREKEREMTIEIERNQSERCLTGWRCIETLRAEERYENDLTWINGGRIPRSGTSFTERRCGEWGRWWIHAVRQRGTGHFSLLLTSSGRGPLDVTVCHRSAAAVTPATFEYFESFELFELLAARFAQAWNCHIVRAASFIRRPIESGDGHLSVKSSLTIFHWNMGWFFVSVPNLLHWQTQTNKLSDFNAARTWFNSRAQFLPRTQFSNQKERLE